MPEKFLFISYAREDGEFALRLAQDLREAGMAIWIDQLDIPTGARWDDAVEEALKACASFLIILSPASVSSKNVKDEIAFALDEDVPIVPVLYRACDVPLRLRRFQRVDCAADYARGVKLLLANLRKAGLVAAASASATAEIIAPTSPIIKPKLAAPQDMALIPAGSFMMGSEDGFDSEKPVHEVYLDAFYMDKYQVTVAKFKAFIEATGYKTDAEKAGHSYAYEGTRWVQKKGIHWQHNAKGELVAPNDMNHPVIHVSWNDAQAYARWTGKRLPTEAEWEYAARSGAKGYKYSWGNEAPRGKKGGNIADEALKRVFKDWAVWEGYDDGFVYTAPVGSFEPNEFGLYDMTGNVWEWCEDWYEENYYKGRPNLDRNPKGPSTGQLRVLRGGSWNINPPYLRCANRNWVIPTYQDFNVGIRCAQDALF